MICILRGTNDVQMTFDDSYIIYISQLEPFIVVFVLVFTN